MNTESTERDRCRMTSQRLLAGLFFAAPVVLVGCSHAPEYSIFGSFFPVWIFCSAGGLVLMAAARALIARTAIAERLAAPVLSYLSMLCAMQQTFPWGHTAGLTGGLTFSLNWTVFDGGARRNNLAQAQTGTIRDQIADQVWAAYSNLNTAFRQHKSAEALLEASSKSYDAALESYDYGLRNFLDVTAAQHTLAQARSADVFARTQVLEAFVDLALRTGDAVQPTATVP